MFIPIEIAVCALLAGVALIALECFLPGVGLPGFLGGALSLFGIIFLIPYIGWYIIIVILSVAAIILLCIYLFAKTAEEGKNPLVLSAKADKKSGFSANEDLSSLISKEGEAVTPLRPAGIALVDSKRVDVVTDGEFIEAGEKLTIVDIQGRRIIVKKI